MSSCRLIRAVGVLLASSLALPAPGAQAVTGSVKPPAGNQAATIATLPALQADLQQTTVSGLSSGAFMAAQFAVAYSATVSGAGMIAGGPFYCASQPGRFPFIAYLNNALTTCMNPAEAQVAPPVASELLKAAQDFARDKLIDDTANLQRQRIYLFSGTRDRTVTRAVVEQVARFYQLAGTPAAQVRLVDNVAAGHAIITDSRDDAACDQTQSPFINNCGFMQSQALLQHLYPELKPPVMQPGGKLIAFNQRNFIRSSYSSMSNTGYVYVPDVCNRESCRVHVAFHGCLQTTQAISMRFVTGTGYNQIADSNRIIVLYPQAEPSPIYPYNPKGCWDFWGYTSINPLAPDFYRKDGTQMAAVKAMLDRLGARRGTR